MQYAICLAAFSLLVFSANPALGEESEPFFERDFARSPSREGRGLNETIPVPSSPEPAPVEAAPTATPDGPLPISERVKAIAAGARNGGAGLRPGKTVIPTPAPQMKVALAGAILDGSSVEKLTEQIDGMLAVLDKTGILISTIYAIGPTQRIPLMTQYRVSKKQGRILFAEELPAKYAAVKEAPTWIFSSTDQEIIVEAAGPFSENLTDRGVIISRGKPVPPASALTPQPIRPRTDQ